MKVVVDVPYWVIDEIEHNPEVPVGDLEFARTIGGDFALSAMPKVKTVRLTAETPKPEPKPERVVIDTEQKLRSNFPQELADLLTVSNQGGEWWLTKPYDRSEEGKAAWVKINELVKTLGGSWDSAGRDSHWSVPK